MIIVLLGIIVYTFVIRPVIQGYIVKGQHQGVQYAVASIMEKAATCQPVSLVFENKTINLIAIECFNNSIIG